MTINQIKSALRKGQLIRLIDRLHSPPVSIVDIKLEPDGIYTRMLGAKLHYDKRKFLNKAVNHIVKIRESEPERYVIVPSFTRNV